MSKNFDDYRRAVNFLHGLHNLPSLCYIHDRSSPGIFLRRTRALLDAVGRPDVGLKVIHITGTAGKGTTAAMTAGILQAAGRTVGLFTSPYSTTALEKIQVNGRLIPPELFVELVETKIKPVLDRLALTTIGVPSSFECFLAVALLAFQRLGCEYAVLEAGLGGRYDATNVIRRPVATAVTMVDFDHTHVLGRTLRSIATDKAGIIKPGVPFFTAETRPAVRRIFQTICRDLNAPYSHAPVRGSDPNAALAAAIGRHLGVNDSTISRGIAAARLPCRFEIMQRRPTVILDGAHNPAKIRYLINVSFPRTRESSRKIIVVAAFADGKNTRAMLRTLAPIAKRLILTRFEERDRTAADPAELMGQIRPMGPIELFLDPHRALERALSLAKPTDTILATGSFYLVGSLRTRWITEDNILKNRTPFPSQK